ncbi:hypothetical protein Sjap_003783 [Stephania japonica]|uniref:Uncharacterized protein n=1 Tax=Stephania japonica TaxID=461633 RepID=A0AAP0KR06_9MAGN
MSRFGSARTRVRHRVYNYTRSECCEKGRVSCVLKREWRAMVRIPQSQSQKPNCIKPSKH